MQTRWASHFRSGQLASALPCFLSGCGRWRVEHRSFVGLPAVLRGVRSICSSSVAAGSFNRHFNPSSSGKRAAEPSLADNGSWLRIFAVANARQRALRAAATSARWDAEPGLRLLADTSLGRAPTATAALADPRQAAVDMAQAFARMSGSVDALAAELDSCRERLLSQAGVPALLSAALSPQPAGGFPGLPGSFDFALDLPRMIRECAAPCPAACERLALAASNLVLAWCHVVSLTLGAPSNAAMLPGGAPPAVVVATASMLLHALTRSWGTLIAGARLRSDLSATASLHATSQRALRPVASFVLSLHAREWEAAGAMPGTGLQSGAHAAGAADVATAVTAHSATGARSAPAMPLPLVTVSALVDPEVWRAERARVLQQLEGGEHRIRRSAAAAAAAGAAGGASAAALPLHADDLYVDSDVDGPGGEATAANVGDAVKAGTSAAAASKADSGTLQAAMRADLTGSEAPPGSAAAASTASRAELRAQAISRAMQGAPQPPQWLSGWRRRLQVEALCIGPLLFPLRSLDFKPPHPTRSSDSSSSSGSGSDSEAAVADLQSDGFSSDGDGDLYSSSARFSEGEQLEPLGTLSGSFAFHTGSSGSSFSSTGTSSRQLGDAVRCPAHPRGIDGLASLLRQLAAVPGRAHSAAIAAAMSSSAPVSLGGSNSSSSMHSQLLHALSSTLMHPEVDPMAPPLAIFAEYGLRELGQQAAAQASPPMGAAGGKAGGAGEPSGSSSSRAIRPSSLTDVDAWLHGIMVKRRHANSNGSVTRNSADNVTDAGGAYDGAASDGAGRRAAAAQSQAPAPSQAQAQSTANFGFDAPALHRWFAVRALSLPGGEVLGADRMAVAHALVRAAAGLKDAPLPARGAWAAQLSHVELALRDGTAAPPHALRPLLPSSWLAFLNALYIRASIEAAAVQHNLIGRAVGAAAAAAAAAAARASAAARTASAASASLSTCDAADEHGAGAVDDAATDPLTSLESPHKCLRDHGVISGSLCDPASLPFIEECALLPMRMRAAHVRLLPPELRLLMSTGLLLAARATRRLRGEEPSHWFQLPAYVARREAELQQQAQSTSDSDGDADGEGQAGFHARRPRNGSGSAYERRLVHRAQLVRRPWPQPGSGKGGKGGKFHGSGSGSGLSRIANDGDSTAAPDADSAAATAAGAAGAQAAVRHSRRYARLDPRILLRMAADVGAARPADRLALSMLQEVAACEAAEAAAGRTTAASEARRAMGGEAAADTAGGAAGSGRGPGFVVLPLTRERALQHDRWAAISRQHAHALAGVREDTSPPRGGSSSLSAAVGAHAAAAAPSVPLLPLPELLNDLADATARFNASAEVPHSLQARLTLMAAGIHLPHSVKLPQSQAACLAYIYLRADDVVRAVRLLAQASALMMAHGDGQLAGAATRADEAASAAGRALSVLQVAYRRCNGHGGGSFSSGGGRRAAPTAADLEARDAAAAEATRAAQDAIAAAGAVVAAAEARAAAASAVAYACEVSEARAGEVLGLLAEATVNRLLPAMLTTRLRAVFAASAGAARRVRGQDFPFTPDPDGSGAAQLAEAAHASAEALRAAARAHGLALRGDGIAVQQAEADE